MSAVQRHKQRVGFTLIELLVTISIIALLALVLLPAVQASREASRLVQCRNNLKQIGLAAELFQSALGAYPPARYAPRPGDDPERSCGGSETTWLVRIMPFLEAAELEREWDYGRPYDEHPAELRNRSLSVYCCPARRQLEEAVGEGVVTSISTEWIPLPCGCMLPVVNQNSKVVSGALGDYGGNHGDLSPGAVGLPTDFNYGGNGNGIIISSRPLCGDGRPVDWLDRITHADVRDGLSKTLLAGEMHVPLGKLRQAPEDAFIFNGDQLFNSARIGGPTVPIVTDLNDAENGLVSWGSWHASSCQFVMADGSVHSINSSIDTETLSRLANRADGQVVDINAQ